MREIKPLGRRFFWVRTNGSIVAQRGEMSAGIESTKEEDFAVYQQLQGLDPDAIEMTTLEPGQYAEDFAKAKGWCFDPETKQIQFLFPDPNDPEAPPVYRKPLSEELEETKSRITDLELTIAEMMTM
ncbi:hypothetical protein [Paenibacillus sp. MSJ-34]|uniref:hypothetical protein n=1 Tax=Paenibacillus sp. MSJ-34 TaxID=2841529 RepID=UPI001C12840E|nr:hypothetical protein [Paenibacillus sp. MSJ-34]MBU5444329.1 hypothetical protein [Paenibacillus sp. MSJ-34]